MGISDDRGMVRHGKYCYHDEGGCMAKNFRIRSKGKSHRKLDLALFGDFDASSACELIQVLDKSANQATKVAIDTDGLRTINTFGLAVLLPHLSGLANSRSGIEITGRFSGVFQEH